MRVRPDNSQKPLIDSGCNDSMPQYGVNLGDDGDKAKDSWQGHFGALAVFNVWGEGNTEIRISPPLHHYKNVEGNLVSAWSIQSKASRCRLVSLTRSCKAQGMQLNYLLQYL